MGKVDTDVAAELPLTPAVFQILLSLATGERHGYALMKEISERTGGHLRLGPGKLYYSIQRMLENGFIAEAEGDGPDDVDERRRYYCITEFGRRVAQAETERLEVLVEFARSRRLGQARGAAKSR